MFNLKNLKESLLMLEMERDSLKHENDELRKKLHKLEASDTILNILEMYVFDDLSFLTNSKFSTIEIISLMSEGDMGECTCHLWYGVKVFGIDNQNNKTELFSIPVKSTGDGLFVSDFALKGRNNIFNLTKSIAEYLKCEIERIDGPVKVITNEIKIDELLVLDETKIFKIHYDVE